MTRLLVGLGLLAAGCTAGRTTVAPAPPTAVRTGITDAARSLLDARLGGDNWQGEVIDVTRAGQSAGNPDEEWDETTVRVSFAARGADGQPRLLAQPEMAALLRGLRTDIRRLVTAAGGDNQDSADGEQFRERSLVCPYRLGNTAGWVRAAIGPASHKHEETVSRLELVVREMPAR